MAEVHKGDLTVIFMTMNQHPRRWVDFHWQTLKYATEGFPMILMTREDFPYQADMVYKDTDPPSHLNMYQKLLMLCKMATTPYIATAEDDTLYPREHFTFYRPEMDTIAYDRSRWSLYWWVPVYSLKQRITNATLIAPREEYIDALEERVAKMSQAKPELVSEVGRYEKHLGVKPRKINNRLYCDVPTIQFDPPNSTDSLARERRKKLGQLKANEIPYWGRAEKYIQIYGINSSNTQ